jgi:23S rRNA (cytosine1962-C5)-methyltransferase
MHKVFLLKGKEKPVLQRHNWVFSGAIARAEDGIQKGDIIELCDAQNNFLAYGYYNQDSKINVRLLEWNKNNIIDNQWWHNKIERAIELRKSLINSDDTDSMRLVFSEGDSLPGLIVDQFNDYLSVQFLTAGVDARKELICDILEELVHPKGIYERSDAAARSLEGLPKMNGLLRGELPPDDLVIKENGLVFYTNIVDGQKSGYFLDQRENRKKVAKYCKGKKVLDTFSYTGGFSINAMKASAQEVTSIDSSSLASEYLKKNCELNKFAYKNEQIITADVFQFLRDAKKTSSNWDVIILDPPKLAPNRQSIPKAERAYKDLNMQAISLLEPGQLLVSFSCSGAISLDHFKQIIAWAAKDTGKEVQFIEDLSQPFDHPVRAAFPESLYLKGVIARILG